MAEMKFVAFAGSLRRASYNRGLIRAAVDLAPTGITIDAFDLGDLPLTTRTSRMRVNPSRSSPSSRHLPGLKRCLLRRPSTTTACPVS